MKTLKNISLLTIGAFLLLASNLRAVPSHLTPALMDTLVEPYLQIQRGLAGDDFAAAKQGATAFVAALEAKPMDQASGLKAPATAIAEAADIKAARASFLPLSEGMMALVKEVGTTGHTPLFVAHCPMAFGGEGGDWIQADQTIANPYYGAMMLRCGGINEQIAGNHGGDHAGHMGDGHTGHMKEDHAGHMEDGHRQGH